MSKCIRHWPNCNRRTAPRNQLRREKQSSPRINTYCALPINGNPIKWKFAPTLFAIKYKFGTKMSPHSAILCRFIRDKMSIFENPCWESTKWYSILTGGHCTPRQTLHAGAQAVSNREVNSRFMFVGSWFDSKERKSLKNHVPNLFVLTNTVQRVIMSIIWSPSSVSTRSSHLPSLLTNGVLLVVWNDCAKKTV